MRYSHYQDATPMCEVPDDNMFCAGPCDMGEDGGTRWQYAGNGQGEYQIVEELVWVGEGNGSFGAPIPDEELSLLERGRRFFNKELVCMLFYGSIVCMTLLCLFLGVMMLIPPVASKIDAVLPLPMSHRGEGSRQLPEGARAMQQISQDTTQLLTTTLAPAVMLPNRGIALASSTAAPMQTQLQKNGSAQPVIDVPETNASSKTYDCDDGYFSWRTAWTAEKKDWCCFHHQRGCELSKATTATSAFGSQMHGCDTMCNANAQSAPCGTRIQDAATNVFFAHPHACSLALSKVHSECSACQVCTLADAHCERTTVANPIGVARSMLQTAPVSKVDSDADSFHGFRVFDCSRDHAQCEMTWSREKKAWCSVHGEHRCDSAQIAG